MWTILLIGIGVATVLLVVAARSSALSSNGGNE